MKFLPFALLAVALISSLTQCQSAMADEAPLAPAIIELNVKPLPGAYQNSRKTPTKITSAKEAAEAFDEATLKKISKSVDFKKQIILLFAWRGSGQDKLSYIVAESLPEQITFTLTYGRTRDLRSHVRVFALRSDVKWSRK